MLIPLLQEQPTAQVQQAHHGHEIHAVTVSAGRPDMSARARPLVGKSGRFLCAY
jgi:hypothetical protein